MTYIVTNEWVKERLKSKPNDTVIVDVRFELQSPEAGREMYEEGHLPTAVYVDLNKDLSGDVQKHGGNHPLPEIEKFAQKLGDIGIDRETTVIIYDQANDMYAARLWWLLTYVGHEHVYLLDGGYNGWVKAGNEITRDMPKPKQKTFEAQVQSNEKVDITEVKEKLNNKSAILIDSRAKDRYLGKIEPMYAKAGHIPGAKNYFWKGVLADDGLWKTKAKIEAHFADLPKDEEIIVSCGSGVSACPNIIGLKMAGYTNVKLYPGSYSDWISYEDNQVETKEE